MDAKVRIPKEAMPHLSKNRMWRRSGKKTYLNPATRAEIEAIAMQLPSAGWTKAKVWVRVVVYRSDMRSDPANYVDAILDAVELGIGVDDRWFSGSWDWKMEKENPRIEVEVRQ